MQSTEIFVLSAVEVLKIQTDSKLYSTTIVKTRKKAICCCSNQSTKKIFFAKIKKMFRKIWLF